MGPVGVLTEVVPRGGTFFGGVSVVGAHSDKMRQRSTTWQNNSGVCSGGLVCFGRMDAVPGYSHGKHIFHFSSLLVTS